jgi:molybdenum cofactor biosynthesis protein B
MELSDVTKVGVFDDDGFEKVNLFETENFFADVYCFEEGQNQEVHEHANSDKVYHVLDGEAEITVGDKRMAVSEGGAVLAEAGKKHGVEANERTRIFVLMAPHPAHAGTDDHGHAHDHGHPHSHETDETFDVGFVTISSSRDASEDESGDSAQEAVEDAGHGFEYRLVSDDADEIQGTVKTLAADCDAVITSGGTGLTSDDVTVETVRPMLEKEIEGFGEEFRRRSVDEVGTAAMLSRATAGVVGDTAVFVLPGSVGAVETGVPLALAELGHVLRLVRGDS